MPEILWYRPTGCEKRHAFFTGAEKSLCGLQFGATPWEVIEEGAKKQENDKQFCFDCDKELVKNFG